MGNEQALELISAKFGESISHEIDAHGLLNLTVAPDQLIDLVTFLRDDETLAMGFLTTLCGIHYPFNKGAELGVVYHIHSLENNYRIRIKVFVPEEQPHVPSLTGLFASANWQERETFDFYGIQFDGHPDLRRILNMDEMTYHPLRKEYPLEDATREDKADRFFGR